MLSVSIRVIPCIVAIFVSALLMQQGCKPRRSHLRSDEGSDLKKHLSYISLVYAQFKETPYLFLPEPVVRQNPLVSSSDPKEAIKEISMVAPHKVDENMFQEKCGVQLEQFKNIVREEREYAAGEDDPIERLLDYIYRDYEFDIRIFAAEVLYEIAYANMPYYLVFKYRDRVVDLNELMNQIFVAIRKPLDMEEPNPGCSSDLECLKKLETLVAMSRWTDISNGGMEVHSHFKTDINSNNDGRIRHILQDIISDIQRLDFGDTPQSGQVRRTKLLFAAELSSLWIEMQMASRIHSMYGFDTYYFGSKRQDEIQKRVLDLISRIEKRFFDATVYAKTALEVTEQYVHIFGTYFFKDFYKIYVTKEIALEADEKFFHLTTMFQYDHFESSEMETVKRAYISAIKLWHFNNTFTTRNPTSAFDCLNRAANMLTNRSSNADFILSPLQSDCLNRPLTREQVLDIYMPEVPVIEYHSKGPYRTLYRNRIDEILRLGQANYERIRDGVSFEYKQSLFRQFVEPVVRDQTDAIRDFFAQNNLPTQLGGENAEQFLAENLKGFRSWSVEIDKIMSHQMKSSIEMAYLQVKMQNNRSGDNRNQAEDELEKLLKDDPMTLGILKARICADDIYGEQARWLTLSYQNDAFYKRIPELAAYYTGIARITGWFNEGKVRTEAAQEMAAVSRQDLIMPLKFACLSKYYEENQGRRFNALHVVPSERDAAQAATFFSKIINCPVQLIDLSSWHSNGAPFVLPQEGAFNLNAICPANVASTSTSDLTRHFNEYMAKYDMHARCEEVSNQAVMQVASFAVMGPAFKVGFGIAGRVAPLLKEGLKNTPILGRLIERGMKGFGIMRSSQFGPGFTGLARNMAANHNAVLASIIVRGGEYMFNSAIRGLSFTLMNKIFMMPLSGLDGVLALEAGQTFSEALAGRSGFALYREIGQGVIFGMIGPSFDGISRWSNISLYGGAGRAFKIVRQQAHRAVSRFPRINGTYAVKKAFDTSTALAHWFNSGGTRGLGVVLFEEAWVFPFDITVTQLFYRLEEWVTGDPAQKETFAEFIGNNLLGVFILRRSQLPGISQSAGLQTIASMKARKWIDSGSARIRNKIERLRKETDPGKRAQMRIENDLRYLGIDDMELASLKSETGTIEDQKFMELVHKSYHEFEEAHGNERFDQDKRMRPIDILRGHAIRYRGDGVYTNLLNPEYRKHFLEALNSGNVKGLVGLGGGQAPNLMRDLRSMGVRPDPNLDRFTNELRKRLDRNPDQGVKQKIEEALEAYKDPSRFKADMEGLNSGARVGDDIDPVDLF